MCDTEQMMKNLEGFILPLLLTQSFTQAFLQPPGLRALSVESAMELGDLL